MNWMFSSVGGLRLTRGRGFIQSELDGELLSNVLNDQDNNMGYMYCIETEQAGLPLSRGRGFIAKTQKICRQGTEAHTRKVFQANNRNYRINMKTTRPPAFFQAACKTISL